MTLRRRARAASGFALEQAALGLEFVHPEKQQQARRQFSLHTQMSVTYEILLSQFLLAAHLVLLQLDEDAVFSTPDQVDVLSILCTKDHPVVGGQNRYKTLEMSKRLYVPDGG